MSFKSKLVTSRWASIGFALIARQTNLIRQPLSLGKYRVKFPGGFAYGSFNGAAQLKPWSLIRMVEASRGAVFLQAEDGKSFIDANLLVPDYLMFILTSSMQIRKELYEIDYIKAPVTFDIELENIGRTSFQLKSSIFVNDFPDPLIVSRVKTVFVCSKSGRSKSPPDWWQEKFSKEIVCDEKPLGRLDMSDKDDERSTESNFIVPASDVDPYLHTNWSNYVKYCYSAWAEHIVTRAQGKNKVDIFRNLKEMTVVYQNETSVGDSLTINVSPHLSDPNTFYCNIAKDENTACVSKMEYY